jgi:hypothetical protein
MNGAHVYGSSTCIATTMECTCVITSAPTSGGR